MTPASAETPVLIVEPEAFDEDLRSSLPNGWNVRFVAPGSQAELESACRSGSYQVLFARLGFWFGTKVLDALPGLQAIATPTTGIDHIDLGACAERGVAVLSLRGEREFLDTITTTAEHTWSLLLACTRRLSDATGRVRAGRWDRVGLELHQLAGRTLGVIGAGRLGSIVCRYGRAFGMKVLAADPNVGAADLPAGVELVPLPPLLAAADFIVLLASYYPGDPPILGVDAFGTMKHGVVVVNVARGELLDEDALADALEAGQVSAAGLDVLRGDSAWESMRPPVGRLADLSRRDSRLVITPHVGGYAVEAIRATRAFLVRKVQAFLADRSRAGHRDENGKKERDE